MIMYDFYTDRTSGPIVNYLCALLPHTRLVDYQLIDVNQKLFTFGCEGETFYLLITKDDDVRVGIGQRLLDTIKSDESYRDIFRINLISHLTKVARDYKLKEILH